MEKQGYIKTPIGMFKNPSFWLIQASMFAVSVYIVVQLGEHVFKNIKDLEVLGLLANPFVASFLVLFTWLHEMAHRLVLRAFKIPVVGPFLLVPIGGLMVVGTKPKPKQQILSAIYGPFIGLLAFPMYFIAVTTRSTLWAGAALFWGGISFINLLPLLPFDGGVVMEKLLISINNKAGVILKYLSIALFLGLGLFKIQLLVLQVILILFLWFVDYFAELIYKKFLGNTEKVQYPPMNKMQTIRGFCEYFILLFLLGYVTYLNFTLFV